MSKYLGPIKILGTSAVIVFLFGRIFPTLSKELLSEDTRDSVLVRAIPFVTVFVSIILLYILLIFIVAIRFNGKIPYRTYRPIELTVIAGILIGIFCLFQPWELIGYEYGFLLLLASTIGFIMWSHIVPQSAANGKDLAPFELWHHAVAVIAALLVLSVFAYNFTQNEKPASPYGYTQRQWDRGLRPERKAEIIKEAEDTYNTYEVPFLIFISIGPALPIYFFLREILASAVSKERQANQSVAATTSA
ncbi:MAG: hypothetical protein F9K46_11140 [Anaerolineae bacterium]|nr:MAG: hypothetical protein F9K46_11140 [Anaerolineae bacterium]